MIVLVLAVYAYILFEAWSLSHPVRSAKRPESGTVSGLAQDLDSLEVTPVEPLRLPLSSARAIVPTLAAA